MTETKVGSVSTRAKPNATSNLADIHQTIFSLTVQAEIGLSLCLIA
jgi:hypothetical protein